MGRKWGDVKRRIDGVFGSGSKPEPTLTTLDKVDDLKPGDIVMVERFGAGYSRTVIYYEILQNENGWISTAQEYNYSHGFANRAIERGEVIVTLLPPSLGRSLLQAARGDAP